MGYKNKVLTRSILETKWQKPECLTLMLIVTILGIATIIKASIEFEEENETDLSIVVFLLNYLALLLSGKRVK